MSQEKIERSHRKEVVYSKDHWQILRAKRTRAKELLEIFPSFKPYIYGSVARGDVHKNSDLDLIFLDRVPIFKVEYLLYAQGIEKYSREILMATPIDPIKLYIHLNEFETLQIPMTKLETRNLEFFDFGGKIDLKGLQADIRVKGVDKRLVFIEPNDSGHREYSIIDSEPMVAKSLGVHIDTVQERKEVLLRREQHGRTGVFLKRELALNETPATVLREIAKKNSIVRKKLRSS